ncbi:MAG: sulfurtransferase [Rubrimonas sp.]|uniref:sulfurtransferase n=1 Tax=Rubrimonas sp. TaxID=2036015 RepID=UPI002FDCC8D3
MKFATRTLLASTAAIAFALPAMAAGPLVSADELLTMLSEGKVLALDVREAAKEGPTAYAKGHIPGSVYAPMDMANWRTTRDGIPAMAPDADKFQAYMRSLGLDRGEQVVLIYSGVEPGLGDLAAATRAYWTLKSMGHEKVAILNGGVAGWAAAGLNLAVSPTEPAAAGNFTARFSDVWLADAADVQAALTSDVKLIDARPTGQYAGESKHPKAKKAGHIPGAPNLYGGKLLDGAMVKDAAAIEKLFAEVGVSASDDVITYCNGGFYCSAIWFAAHEILGYDKVRVYDGSMIDWTQDESRPVATGPAS